MAKKKMSEGLENALQKLVDRLVERMEDASESLEWNQGWVQSGAGFGLPRNISGSPYMGMNAFLLSLHTAENGYKMPIYMTHLQAKKEKVHILPGSKSIPVFKWGKNIRDKEGKFVSEEDYHKMSEEQQKECTVYPYLKHFNEFNIDQTNYKEKYPDKYEKLLSNFVDPDRNKADTNGMYNNEALNKVIEEKDGWICPIVLDPARGAAYNPGFNSIHIPPKGNYRIHEGNAEETFKDGQEYYSTALHEMAHSTGHESVLKRDGIVKFGGFGSPSYAKEELVAELTAAMVSSTLGFDKRITENSAAYLKGWAAALRKEPKYIISVMSDVNKASRIELEHIDKQRKALGQKSLLEGTLDGLDEKADNEKQFEAIQNGETEKEQNNNIMDKKIFYSNLSDTSDIDLKEDPQQLAAFYEKGDKQGLFDALKQAQKESGASWDLTTLESTIGENAEIIAEDEKHIAVKYPYFIPGTFFMFEKVTEQQILDKIQQQGLSEDDSEIAHQIGNEAVKKQFDGMSNHTVEMPDGTVLGVDYDSSTNELIAGGITNAGVIPEHSHNYDHSITLDENLQNFSEELMSMDEYQAQEEDIEEKVSEDQEETKEKVQDVDKKEHAAKEWSTIDNKLEMPSGDTLTVDYNKEKDTLDVLITTPEGKQEVYSTGYDHDHEAKANLGFVWEELSNKKQYQEKESEKEVQAQSVDPKDEKKYYSSFAFMQDQEDTEQFDKLQEEGKYDEILNLASEYDQKKDTLNVAYINEYGYPNTFSTKYRHENSTTKNVGDLWEKFAGMKQYQAKQEEKTSKDGQKAEVPHEDSLSDTNVVAEAKHIAATGVPIDKAEKMAKDKFEDTNHENMHKEEERKSAEQEKKEAQQKEQQKKKEEEQKKENKNSNAVSSHAALLLAALVSSKNNNGVWLNPGFRKDAQFLFGISPITGYNALMMNLHSEQNGYRSSIYTQYNPAKDNGMPIKEGEKAFYLSWTNWRYVKGAEDKQGISSKEYHSLDSKEKKMYQPRSERKVMNVWNIDQTTFAGKDYDAYVKVIKENGDQVESLNNIKEENIARAYSEVVKKHPDFVVLQLEDDVFKAYKKGAEKISKVTGIPMTKVDYLGKKVNSVEISKDKLDGYLSKIVNSGNQVVICDKPESPRLIKTLTKPEEVLQKANSLAKSVAKTEGLDYDREMVVRDAQYLPGEKKIVVSGMSDPGMDARSSAIAKANDIYRVLAAMTGTSDRLDRGGHVNLTPIDDVKYEKLVRELTAGVFMARQGLPATFSKESMELVPYWEREIKESPRMVSIIEKDVNNAVEVLDRLEKNIKPDYKKIVGMKAEKQMLNKSDYTIIKKINEFPNIDTKEIVVVKDTVNKKASVILPQGASLEKDNEVPGMRKDRIKNALCKEGFEVEKFYNAGGRLGLKQPNNYFADKEISVVRLHQYELISNEKVDLSDLKKEVKFKIKDFQVLPDKELGRYFFHIQAEGEKAFDIVPEKKYVNSFFKAIKSPDPEDKSKMIKALSEQFYKLGKAYPEMIVDLVSPRKVDVDMSRISSSHIYKSQEDPKIKYIKAVIDGQEHVKVIPADQYNKLFAAEDKPAYAKALAAVTFESLLKKGNTESVDNSQKDTNEKNVSKATPIEQSAVNKTVGQQEDNEHHQSMKFGRR